MSGGSFNYLCFEIEERPLSFSTLESLSDMADWLSGPEQGQVEAATELRELHKYLVSTKEEIDSKLNGAILSVMKEAEWWGSNDTGKDDFVKKWQEYKEWRAKDVPQRESGSLLDDRPTGRPNE